MGGEGRVDEPAVRGELCVKGGAPWSSKLGTGVMCLVFRKDDSSRIVGDGL